MNAAAKELRFESMKQWELVRFLSLTPIEGAWAIWLLVAVQYFEASPFVKSFIASSTFFGLLISPFMLTVLSRFQLRISTALSSLYVIGAIGMLFIALSQSLTFFLAGVSLAAVTGCSPPLIAALWEQNSPASTRGLSYSKMFLFGLSAKIITGLLISFWLGDDIQHFRPVPILFCLLYISAAYAVRQIESEKLNKTGVNPLSRLSLVWSDKIFGTILLAWMFLGVSNLTTFPLRTEFLASGKPFEAYAPWLIVLLIDVVPTIFRMASVVLWGKLFDKVNFILLRGTLNLIFGLSTLCFFTPILGLQIFGAMTKGFGHGGAGVAWSLWVTKFAPPEKTADYMAVHTFLTGIRGILSPMLAFWAIQHYTFGEFSYFAASLAFVAVLILAPIAKYGNRN